MTTIAITTETIWKEFHKKLFHFIEKRVKDPTISEDILQDIFIKIHLKLDTLTDQEKLTSWVYQVARNSVMDYFRKQKPLQEIKDDFPDLAEEKAFNNELSDCIKPFIRQLPDLSKDVILKVELGNLSQKEYAKQLGISYSGAKSRLQRARKQLHSLFNQCCCISIDSYGNVMEYEKCEKICGCK